MRPSSLKTSYQLDPLSACRINTLTTTDDNVVIHYGLDIHKICQKIQNKLQTQTDNIFFYKFQNVRNSSQNPNNSQNSNFISPHYYRWLHTHSPFPSPNTTIQPELFYSNANDSIIQYLSPHLTIKSDNNHTTPLSTFPHSSIHHSPSSQPHSFISRYSQSSQNSSPHAATGLNMTIRDAIMFVMVRNGLLSELYQRLMLLNNVYYSLSPQIQINNNNLPNFGGFFYSGEKKRPFMLVHKKHTRRRQSQLVVQLVIITTKSLTISLQINLAVVILALRNVVVMDNVKPGL